jgi:ComF family protein
MKLFVQSRFCVLCGQIHKEKTLCLACQQFLPFTGTICQLCGIPITQSILCGRCLTKKFPYRQIIPCFWYEDPIQTLIHDYKFRKKLFLTPILSRLMIEKIQMHYQQYKYAYPECLIPLPLHPKRLRERGYHQIYEIAKILSTNLAIPTKLKICRRTQHTPPQSHLPFKSRKGNVQHVFATKKVPYKHVAVIDDVVTSGATVSSLCQTLKNENPELIIDVWCLARTKPRT